MISEAWLVFQFLKVSRGTDAELIHIHHPSNPNNQKILALE